VRFHKPSNDPWYAVRHGHEIQILDNPDAGETRGTGSIYAYADAPKASEAVNPPGEWNTYEITVKGDTYTVILNGKEILEWDSPTERHGREGYVGLQNHDDNSPVRFRNIRVKLLD
jgi:cytochrome c